MPIRITCALTLAAVLAAALPAPANNGGIPGYSGNPAHNGGQICNSCHSGGVAPLVVLSGPSTVDGGTTHTYSVSVSGGQQVACGFGASAGDGELLVAEPGTQIFNGDATHTAPRAVDGMGGCTFTFDWMAPYAGGSVEIYAAGNSVNDNAQTAGDQAAADSLTVMVNGAPPGMIPPLADADGPHSAVLGNPIAFDGTGSTDSDGSVVAWDWDFGDGQGGSGAQPSHTYASTGSYTVTLTVTDDDDYSDVDTTTATVLAEPGGFVVRRIIQHGLLQGATFVTAPAGDDRLFVVFQGGFGATPDIGKIFIVDEDDQLITTPFLEIPIGLFGAESGFRGLRFAPDYATSGNFYVLYSDANQDTVVSRFQVGADPDLADPESEEEIIRIPQPNVGHNSSHLQFGPDGMLYVGVGDGGIQSNGQNVSNLLGSIIRIDPSAGGMGYAIPTDNPFVGPGDPVDEVFAYGFRNPYAFDFDVLTGDLYIADVGAATWEEVDVGTLFDVAGGNYGWQYMEGTLCLTGQTHLCDGPKLPVHEYDHEDGRCAIIGGVVYRGAIPSLYGRFLFADWCSHQIWSLLWDGAGGVVDVTEHTSEMIPDVGEISNIAAIQRDGHGELVIVDRQHGELFRVVEVECNLDADCGDGAFCNGVESCVANRCEPGAGDPCAGGPDPVCDESADACVPACIEDADCSDGIYCNGLETCAAGVCLPGPGDPCTGGPDPYCDETGDLCSASCVVDAHCNDGSYCNGLETCSAGACLPGPGDPCAGGPDPYCDETGDLCVACLTDPDCSDGAFCNGAETCSAGVCQAGPGDPCAGGPDPLCDEGGDVCSACLSDDDCSGEMVCTPGGVCVNPVPAMTPYWQALLGGALLGSALWALRRPGRARARPAGR